MSLEQLKPFLSKVKGDSNLQEKLKAAADSDAVPRCLAIAKDAGFMISIDDARNAQSEVSEEVLEAAAGGDASVMCAGTVSNCCYESSEKLTANCCQ